MKKRQFMIVSQKPYNENEYVTFLILRCDIPVVYCSQCTIGESVFRREHNRL
jgi:hypothetical protein